LAGNVCIEGMALANSVGTAHVRGSGAPFTMAMVFVWWRSARALVPRQGRSFLRRFGVVQYREKMTRNLRRSSQVITPMSAELCIFSLTTQLICRRTEGRNLRWAKYLQGDNGLKSTVRYHGVIKWKWRYKKRTLAGTHTCWIP